MTMPTGKFTLEEAAQAWIDCVKQSNADGAKGTPEQEAALIAKINSGLAEAQKAREAKYGAGCFDANARYAFDYNHHLLLAGIKAAGK